MTLQVQERLAANVADALGRPAPPSDLGVATAAMAEEDATPDWPESLVRTSAYLTHPVFHRHRSETFGTEQCGVKRVSSTTSPRTHSSSTGSASGIRSGTIIVPPSF